MKKLLPAALCLFGMTCAAWSAPDDTAKYEAANVSDVLTEYGKLTGKRILFDNTVQGQLAAVVSRSDNPDRKVELIEKALFLNGFALIDAGDDVVEVIGLGRPARNYALPIYTKPEELPGGQRVFSYLFKLEHREPRELAAFFQQYIPPSATVAFTPDPGSRTLLVTGPTSLIRTLIKQIPALDVPGVADGQIPRSVRPPLPPAPAPPKPMAPHPGSDADGNG